MRDELERISFGFNLDKGFLHLVMIFLKEDGDVPDRIAVQPHSSSRRDAMQKRERERVKWREGSHSIAAAASEKPSKAR